MLPEKELYTKWGREVDPGNVLSEYPRPQFIRSEYTNLNGHWSYAFTRAGEQPGSWKGKILVPFSPEAPLSGVGRQLQPDERLWLRRSVSIDSFATGSRYLLHFGAVDQSCAGYVNGKKARTHVGGYTPFTCDITSFIRQGKNTLSLCITDKSDTSYHARGKQKLERGGMYYTASSGIWQSVWMERVPEYHIEELHCGQAVDEGLVIIAAKGMHGKKNTTVKLTFFEPGIYSEKEFPASDVLAGKELPVLKSVEMRIGSVIRVLLPDVRMWSPEEPWLYYYLAEFGEDRVLSYFGMRTVSVEKEENTGVPRIMLNHEPVFMRGVLDQGYWPDGLMTAPSDEALIFDITEMKKTGFNMVRKHIKIEPERWYYHCDRLGILVWQDMVNGGSSYNDWYVTYAASVLNSARIRPKDFTKKLLSREDKDGRVEFEREAAETLRILKNHPSIAVWVLFNEGWGQFDTVRLTERLKELDPTRLVDSASGWFDQGCGDLISLHHYYGPFPWRRDKKRAVVLSEFGGFVFREPGHSVTDSTYGYKTYESRSELEEGVRKLIRKREKYINKGLCAWVYAQWSDIEDEENGIFTYDREVRKIDTVRA